MSDGMRRELVYLSSHATNRYFIPNWGNSSSVHVYICVYPIKNNQPLSLQWLIDSVF